MAWRILLMFLFLVTPYAVSDSMIQNLEPRGGRLAACPDTPNCVSSDAADPTHRLPPFTIIHPAKEAWRLVRETVEAIPRTKITEATEAFLRAECRSLIFRFVDDLELELREDEGIIAVRSASRTGKSDFGVNRRRVERLRSALQLRGAIK